MLEIIEQGKSKFIVRCPKCGCKYSYNLDDLKGLGTGTYCPSCENYVIHPRQDIEDDENKMKIKLFENNTNNKETISEGTITI